MNLVKTRAELVKFFTNSQIKYKKLSKHGNLEMSRLAFYNTSGLIYSIPADKEGKKVHIRFIIDVSGSMEGAQYNLTSKAIIELTNLFDGLVSMDYVAFGTIFKKVHRSELKSSKIIRKFCEAFYPIVEINGVKNLLPIFLDFSSSALFDNSYCDGWYTYSPSPIKQSIEDLKNLDGDKIIIFLTDGNDNLNPNHFRLNEVAGVSTNYKGEYKLLMHEMDEAGIGFLPLGIYTNMKHWNGIELSDIKDIYPIVLNFLKDKYLNNGKNI